MVLGLRYRFAKFILIFLISKVPDNAIVFFLEEAFFSFLNYFNVSEVLYAYIYKKIRAFTWKS